MNFKVSENSSENQIPTQESTSSVDYNSLTSTGKNQYDALVNFYGDKTIEVVTLLDARGNNSYKSVYEKAELIKTTTEYSSLNYNRSVSGSFEVNSTYKSQDFVDIISETRRSLKMPPILTKVKSNSLAEVNRLFITKPVYHFEDELLPKNKRRIIGYTVLFDLTDQIED